MTVWRFALAVLVLAGCKPTSDRPLLVKYVDELVPADHDRELRVRGTVEGPIIARRDGDLLVTVFTLANKGKRLRVLATGVLPDLFREHVDGAATGRWLDADEARPILIARGISDETEVFDARDVIVQLPDFTLGSAAR